MSLCVKYDVPIAILSMIVLTYIFSFNPFWSILTFGHLYESHIVVCRILVLQKRRVFNETCLLRRALLWAPGPRHGQGTGQKPERDGRQEGDDPGYEVAQPPGPHPAGICWGDGDSFCCPPPPNPNRTLIISSIRAQEVDWNIMIWLFIAAALHKSIKMISLHCL